MTESMGELVRRWDAAVIAREAAGGELPEEVREQGTTLREPAQESTVAALEDRLGVALPPSYRDFLRTTDGCWAQPGWNAVVGLYGGPTNEAGLLAAAQVGWVREKDPEMVAIWTDSMDGVELALTDEEYADHDRQQDAVQIRVEHMPHLLQVSSCIDGYVVYLNPLVVDAAGEWEAWDFGTKHPGALRYRSFRSLMEAALAEVEAPPWTPPPPAPDADVAAAFASLLRGEFQPFESGGQLDLVRHVADPAARLDDLVTLTGPSYHLWVRQAALAAIARVPGHRTLEVILACTAGEPPVQLQAVTIARLADDPDPRAHAEAVRLLGLGEAANFVRPGQTDILWEAWQATGHLSCVRELAQRFDGRAVEPIRLALLDPATDPEMRGRLAYMGHYVRDPSLVDAIVTAHGFGGVVTHHAVSSLMALQAWDEAAGLVTPEALEDPNALPDLLAQDLAEIARASGHPGATRVLLAQFTANPTAEGAKWLSGLPDDTAVAALEAAATAPRLAKACARALERSPAPGAIAALERLAAGDGPARGPAAAALATRRKAPGTR